MTSYPPLTIKRHAERTGLDFHAALEDLIRTQGPAPLYPCTECGEVIVTEPDRMCGSCLFDPDYE